MGWLIAECPLTCRFYGGRGRNRILNQAYFQQHAGWRMTPKTVQRSRDQSNKAQIERVFATSVLSVRQAVTDG
jgi:hypothetical protein